MRMNGNSREITVNKAELISKIEENKQNHETEYIKAVEAYKVEAAKQLKAQVKALADGSLSIRINLVAPSNKSDEYDKIASMFKWEQSEQVVLSQGEFNEYVLDETSFAREARIMNQSYTSLSL